MDSTEKDSNMLLRMKGVCEKIPYVKNKKGVKQKIKLVSLLAWFVLKDYFGWVWINKL